MRRLTVRQFGALTLAMMAGSAAVAQEKDAPAVKPMPEEAWGSVMIDRGADWAAHEPTRRIAELMLRSGALGTAEAAWKELAGVMEMKSPEAFEALLGDRALLVWGRRDELEFTPWGVVTRVSDDRATLLEQKLDAAPRGFDDGRPVVLVERGRFRLCKLDGRDGLEEPTGRTRLLLTPTTKSDSRGWISRTVAATEGLSRSPGSMVAYVRSDATGAYAVASVTRQERGWDASVRCTPEVLGLTRASCEQLAKEGPATEGVIGPDVLLEVWGRVPSQVPGLVRPPAEIATLLTAARITAPSSQWSGERVVLRVLREKDDGFSVLMACEVKDRRAASAWFDGLISGVLDFAGRVQGTGGQIAAELRQDLVKAGNDPSAMRLVVLGGKAQREKGFEQRPVVDPGTLAWTTVGQGTGGWWVMQYRSGAAERDVAERFLRDAGAEMLSAAWGSRVVTLNARPAAIWKVMGAEALGEQAGLLELASELESVEATLWATPSGIEGAAKVRVTEPKPAAKPQPK
jgi:hypothetical protein